MQQPAHSRERHSAELGFVRRPLANFADQHQKSKLFKNRQRAMEPPELQTETVPPVRQTRLRPGYWEKYILRGWAAILLADSGAASYAGHHPALLGGQIQEYDLGQAQHVACSMGPRDSGEYHFVVPYIPRFCSRCWPDSAFGVLCRTQCPLLQNPGHLSSKC